MGFSQPPTTGPESQNIDDLIAGAMATSTVATGTPITHGKSSSEVLATFPFTATAILAHSNYFPSIPDESQRVFPLEATSLVSRATKKAFFYALPDPGLNLSPRILPGQPSDWSTHVNNRPNNGYVSKHYSRPSAVLAILQHFLTRGTVSSMCTNCFTHHLPAECPDPPRDFQALIDACSSLNPTDNRAFAYAACTVCNKRHAPPANGKCTSM